MSIVRQRSLKIRFSREELKPLNLEMFTGYTHLRNAPEVPLNFLLLLIINQLL